MIILKSRRLQFSAVIEEFNQSFEIKNGARRIRGEKMRMKKVWAMKSAQSIANK